MIEKFITLYMAIVGTATSYYAVNEGAIVIGITLGFIGIINCIGFVLLTER